MAGLTKAQKAEKAILAKAIEISALTAEAFGALTDEEKAQFLDQAKATIDPDDGDDEVDNSHLIKVIKDGEELEVHPAALDNHKQLGWKEA